MKNARYIVYRYLTNNDFFTMYKPPGTEYGGGGQSYIDFGIGSISQNEWQIFFSGVPSEVRAQGSAWTFIINSIGLNVSQELVIWQRRLQTFSISSQKITSRRANRVHAWHPENGFPQPPDPTDRESCPLNLAIYIVRTEDNEFWAGWFQNNSPYRDQVAYGLLQQMLPSAPIEGFAGFIQFPNNTLYMDETDSITPFFTSTIVQPDVQPTRPTRLARPARPARPRTRIIQRRVRSEEEITRSLFEEDENYDSELEETQRERNIIVRNRNTRAVRDLKELYQGQCQITGDTYTFLKRDGTPYCEAHHLIYLGEQGADSPYNIIIVNPLIHRMLHYANVSAIDLSTITDSNTLDIMINDEQYTITWHPDHAEYVRRH